MPLFIGNCITLNAASLPFSCFDHIHNLIHSFVLQGCSAAMPPLLPRRPAPPLKLLWR